MQLGTHEAHLFTKSDERLKSLKDIAKKGEVSDLKALEPVVVLGEFFEEQKAMLGSDLLDILVQRLQQRLFVVAYLAREQTNQLLRFRIVVAFLPLGSGTA